MSHLITLELVKPGLYNLIFKNNSKQVGQAYRDVDGYYYFISDQNSGYYSTEFLYAIADTLKELNLEWDKKIQEL